MIESTGYHAHVYFDAATRPVAERLRETIISRFAVKPGGFSDKPIGPHPVSQFNVMFQTDEFQRIVPWLMLNREGLNVLVHPLTDDMVDDHTVYAMWLGAPVDLKVDTLQRRGYQDALLPTTVVHPA
jgi:DOPA 4,5-dioxygenase